jgi:DNA-binding transcriptional MerR regulator
MSNYKTYSPNQLILIKQDILSLKPLYELKDIAKILKEQSDRNSHINY